MITLIVLVDYFLQKQRFPLELLVHMRDEHFIFIDREFVLRSY